MKTVSILSIACVLGCAGIQQGVGGTATMNMPRPASEYSKDVNGSVSAGYVSRYEYRNMVVSPKFNNSGVFNVNGKMTMPLGGTSFKQSFGAGYSEIFDGKLSDKDQFDAFWSAGKEVLPNLTVGGEYGLVHGGLPGYIAKKMHKSSHSLGQTVSAFAHYDDPGHGYFGTLNIQAGIYGQTGWRMDLEAGKRWSSGFSQSVDFELSAGLGASTSYWGSGIEGMDQFNIKFAAPIRTNLMDDRKGLRIVPFVQTVWGGNTRHKIQRYTGERIIDRFQVVGGVNLMYNF